MCTQTAYIRARHSPFRKKTRHRAICSRRLRSRSLRAVNKLTRVYIYIHIAPRRVTLQRCSLLSSDIFPKSRGCSYGAVMVILSTARALEEEEEEEENNKPNVPDALMLMRYFHAPRRLREKESHAVL